MKMPTSLEDNLSNKKKTYAKPKARRLGFSGENAETNSIPINAASSEVRTRVALLHLASKVDDAIKELKAAKGDKEIFKKVAREVITEVAVHGTMGKDWKSNEFKLKNYTDLDGESCLGLLREANVNLAKVHYVKKGDYVPNIINVDTGNKTGIYLEKQTDDGGKEMVNIFFDHHGQDASNDLSATKITYEALVSLGLLERKPEYDKLVEFVTQTDNKTFPEEKFNFSISHRTMIGLYRFAKFDKLLQFFKDGKKPDDYLTNNELEKYGFIVKDEKTGKVINNSDQQKKIIDNSNDLLHRLEDAGFIVHSERFGDIVIDINKKLQGSFDAVRAYKCRGSKTNCETYIIWDEGKNSFFICTKSGRKLPEFRQGIRVRNSMHIKPIGDGIPLEMSLQEILEILTDNKLQPERKLARYLEEKEGEAQVASAEAASA
jgi:hypothetical protein